MTPLARASAVIAWALVAGMPAVARAGSTAEQCIAANESGQDLRASGKLREARSRFSSCEAATCPAALREDCARRIEEIDRALPSVVFEAKDGAGGDLTDVRVMVDGRPLADRLNGEAMIVDPGKHEFRFERAGAPPVTRVLVIAEGEKDRHEVITFGTIEPGTTAASTAPATASTPAQVSDDGAEAPGRRQRTWGLIAGGAGVVGLVTGGLFGLLAKSTYDDALSQCTQGGQACGQSGHDESERALTEASVSNVAFIAGGALVAAGAVLYLTAPKERPVGVTLVLPRGGAGLGVGGAF